MTRAMSKAVTILPLAPSLIRSRRPTPTSVLCTKQQPLAQRHADVVAELERRRAGAALGAVDHDEVGHDAGLQHRLDDGEEFPRMADAELEADRLAAGELAQLGDEMHHLDRRRKAPWRGRRDAVDAHRRRRACAAISALTLAAGSTPPWPGLAPWLSLISIILTCGSAAVSAKRSGVERAVVVAAAEIAGADLPDDVAAVLAVIGADSRPRRCRARSRPRLAPAFSARIALALTARRSSSPRC